MLDQLENAGTLAASLAVAGLLGLAAGWALGYRTAQSDHAARAIVAERNARIGCGSDTIPIVITTTGEIVCAGGSLRAKR